MARILSILWLGCYSLFLVTTGCAAQFDELRPVAGITRAGYSIQVGAFREVRNAERLAARLQAKGLDAYYFRKDNGLYAVRCGDFPTYDGARRRARHLVGERLIGSFFIAEPRHESLTRAKGPELHAPPPPSVQKRPASDMGGIAARTAERFVGIPYRWGGENVVDGMDCSGFVRAVFNLCGVNIPRTSREQFTVGDKVGRDDLKEGDLVFFGDSAERISHVGIYVGNGKFVHAPRRGEEIKISALDEPYFAKRFVGAKRYF